MLNSIGKVSVVFVAAASLAFAAFAAAMRNGGPNWAAEADELSTDFTLNVTPGDPITYSLTHRRTNVAGKTTPVLAEAVTEARAKQLTEARAELDRLTAEAARLKPLTEAANAASLADAEGLKKREAALMKQLDEVSQSISRINDEIIEKAGAAQKVRAEGQERREEVYRLQNQLELLRNDLYAAQVQRKNLEEEELRLKEILQRLERRQQQLKSTTGRNS